MSGLRVLVVDDEELVRKTVGGLLKRRGDDYDLAADGAEALICLAQKDYDILITDLNMPGMNGLQLVKEAQEIRPELVSMMLTGLGTRSDAIAAIKEGVFDYIEKPMPSLATFSLSIDRAGERARLVRERNALLRDLQQKNVQLEKNLLKLNEAYERLRRQEEALEADLDGAQRMQQNLLPMAFPQLDGMDFFGYYSPCEPLGGDFFDIIPLGNGRAGVYLADVAGHGVRAAMVTVIVREMIRAQRMLHPDSRIFENPEEALLFLNRGLVEEGLDSPLHVTMGYAMIDANTHRIAYGCAGHPKPINVSSPNSFSYLDAWGPALGIDTSPHFQTTEFTIQPGDLFLLYTDGLVDARNRDGNEFETQNLANLMQLCHGLPARKVGVRLEDALLKHQRERQPSDDITFVVIGCQTPAAIQANDGADARSVKIVHLNSLRNAEPPAPAEILAGWSDEGCIIRLTGAANWQLGHTLTMLVAEARERNSASHIDMSACLSMDSTMLGLIFQLSPYIALHEPSEKLLRQLAEIGILDRLRISSGELPNVPMESLETDRGGMRRPDMILSAHESLMGASEQNRERFGKAVEMLRANLEKAKAGVGSEDK